jgi:STE24 endopeptidase
MFTGLGNTKRIVLGDTLTNQFTSDEVEVVIAHEMGHAAIDHYFAIKPPEKIAEMLAQYVDMHLGQE